MKKIVWDKSFSVGVKEMDEQHKQIIMMVNRLIELNGEKVVGKVGTAPVI